MFNFAEQYIFIPLYTLLLALAILSLVFPEKVFAFKKAKPPVYGVILCLSALIQFPILARGYWEMGIAYSKINRSPVFDYSLVALPFLYFAFFVLSIYCQKNALKEKEQSSFTLAVYTSFIIGPFSYLFLMGLYYYFLR